MRRVGFSQTQRTLRMLSERLLLSERSKVSDVLSGGADIPDISDVGYSKGAITWKSSGLSAESCLWLSGLSQFVGFWTIFGTSHNKGGDNYVR